MKKNILWVMMIVLLVTSTLAGCSNNKNDNTNADETVNVAKQLMLRIKVLLILCQARFKQMKVQL